MPASTNPIFIASRKLWGLEIEDTDGTFRQALVVAGSEGSLIDTISATSDDTVSAELELYLDDGITEHLVGSITIGSGAGTDGGITPPVSVLTQAELPWLRDDLSLALENGWTLKAAVQATLSAGKKIQLVAIGGDY